MTSTLQPTTILCQGGLWGGGVAVQGPPFEAFVEGGHFGAEALSGRTLFFFNKRVPMLGQRAAATVLCVRPAPSRKRPKV